MVELAGKGFVLAVLVTGGGGFLGRAIVEKLCAQGETVRVLARSSYPELVEVGVQVIRGDLAERDDVLKAVDGCHTVYHVAAKAGVWGSYDAYFRTNVTGTNHVIAACQAANVPRLIYTSSPSVTFAGRDQDGVDEQEPYPDRYLAHYPHTKAIAERAVIAANDDQLATVSLRPHLIWGPKDNHLVPRIVNRARAGKLKLVDHGQKLVDSVFIDNAADAHLQAASYLHPGSPVAGSCYFISNGEPISMADLINGILKAAGLNSVRKSVSGRLAYLVGAGLEQGYRICGIEREPLMTRFVARQLATAHWFDIGAAKRDFGYQPKVSLNEGFARLSQWFVDH